LIRKSLSIAFLSTVSIAGHAYNLDGNRWLNATATFQIDIPGISPSGIPWNIGFREAANEWTEKTPFEFKVNTGALNPCEGFTENKDIEGFPDGNGDENNSAGFSDSVCGNAFGDSVLAITLTLSQGGLLGFSYIDQSDIIFNSAFQWDIYRGTRRPEIDFRRVALHELGHTLGLDHEREAVAMMAPSIGDIDSLQADDIEGANALYGGPGNCEITDISLNTIIDDSLFEGDCSVLELYGGGIDTSYVDTYRLTLAKETTVNIQMESASLDSVLLITDNKLNGIDFDDDSAGDCDARLRSTLQAGEYLILANTYVEPFKCKSNIGGYKISITDNALPVLHKARALSGSATNAIFHGGASADGGQTFMKSFTNSDIIDVDASIQPDPNHLGKPATFYVVAILSTGQQFARLENGKFQQINNFKALPAYGHTNGLETKIDIPLLKNIQGEALGLGKMAASFFVGYSLESNPTELYFNGAPISIAIQ